MKKVKRTEIGDCYCDKDCTSLVVPHGMFQMSARHVSSGFGSCDVFVARWTSTLLNTLVHAFVTSHVDYCNSVLSSATKKVVDKLQHVQNTVARLVTGTRKYERGLARLMHDDLHLLVIPQQML